MLPLLLSMLIASAGHDVSLQTSDGMRLKASAEIVKGSSSGVVLVHMNGRHRGDWTYLSERLSKSSLSTVAMDLRGHGANQETGSEPILQEGDYQAMVHDVSAAVEFLQSQGVQEVSCVGADLGANLCARVAADNAAIVNLVLLSPGFNIKGVTAGDAFARYGNRPALLVASSEDKYAARTVTVLEDRATGQVHLEMLEKAGHGTKMLNRAPSLEGLVLSWLLGTFELSTGEMVMPRPAIKAQVDEIETSGKKLPSHQD